MNIAIDESIQLGLFIYDYKRKEGHMHEISKIIATW
jgi:hypothetical protein